MRKLIGIINLIGIFVFNKCFKIVFRNYNYSDPKKEYSLVI